MHLGPFDDIAGYLQIAVGGPAGAAAHVIIDITGYYEPLPTT